MQSSLQTTAVDKKPILNRFFGGCCQRLVHLLVLVSAPALAQVPESAIPLALPKAIELTLQRHPQLAVWSARQNELQAQENMANSRERVVLDMSVEDALGTGDYSGVSMAQTTLGARWLLEDEQRTARVNRVQAQREQLTLDRQLDALELSATTARYFVELLALKAQWNLARQAESEARELVNIVQRRVDSGRTSDLELNQVKARLAERALATEEFEHRSAAASYQLSSQWASVESRLQPQGNWQQLPSLPTEAEAFEHLERSPLLQQYTVRQRLLDADSRLARAEASPQWTVGAGVRHIEATGDLALVAQASIPFGLDQKQVAYQQVVQARQNSQAQAAHVSRSELQTRIRVLLLELQHSQHLIKALQSGILPNLESSHQQAFDAWQKGQLGYAQWDSIRQQRLESRERLLDEYLSMQLQWIEFHRLTGTTFSF